MAENLINAVQYLMSLDEDELNELLLSEKYNKANLRKLVKRTLMVANEYKEFLEYEKKPKNQAKVIDEALDPPFFKGYKPTIFFNT